MQIHTPLAGKFSYAIINGKRVDSLEELNPPKVGMQKDSESCRRRLAAKKRKELELLVLSLRSTVNSRKEMIDMLFETDETKTEGGVYMGKQGIKSAIYRTLKKHGLTYGRGGRPVKERS